jgi:hypothetical protein
VVKWLFIRTNYPSPNQNIRLPAQQTVPPDQIKFVLAFGYCFLCTFKTFVDGNKKLTGEKTGKS